MSRLALPLDVVLASAALGDWRPLVERWRASADGQALVAAVDARVAAGAVVHPAQVFRALELTALADTRVVLLGQDPYHGPGQADGIAFSVPAGLRVPPSLRNVRKELQRDLGLAPPASGSLESWCRQGVLMLNRTLTVESARPGSHSKLGWQALTDAIIMAAAEDSRSKVFMFWGAQAQTQAARAQAAGAAHLVLKCNHPSPLSALRPPVPFMGCGHFGRANQHLTSTGQGAIHWGQRPDGSMVYSQAHRRGARVAKGGRL